MADNSDSVKWLVLVPTELERKTIESQLQIPNSIVETCGFGPIVPAARAVQLVGQHRPTRVLLIGIAGVYDDAKDVGTAESFSEVACYGVGVGTQTSFETAGEMGWKHWQGSGDSNAESIGDLIEIAPLSISDSQSQLVTVCSAAENRKDVDFRMEKFPVGIAEDMEGFAVAAACRLAGVPLSIVRGFSNRAGDREKSNWRIADALSAAVELCHQRIVN